jgi:hypothetical protein
VLLTLRTLSASDRAGEAQAGSAFREFDGEVAQLYLRLREEGRAGGPAIRRAIAARIGCPTGERRPPLSIVRVSVSAPPGQEAETLVRVALAMSRPEDVAGLARHLCEVRCRIRVLPWSGVDPRLATCL